jgi:cellulose synthase/poly-beta-1,6-N-acetylglucosamine synthase-like glycosyltransferase
MLRTLALVPQVLAILLIVYTLLTALPGWRTPPPPPACSRRRRFLVIIPAHDEGAVIHQILADLRDQTYPAELVELWVLADRCSDDTAGRAAAAGAMVAERAAGPAGKGALLGWFLEAHPPGMETTVLVLDADNRVPDGFLGDLADVLDAGHEVVQCYLDVSNPDASALSLASALSYWAGNRMVQLARSNLGWSADLGGTGMAFMAGALEAAGGFGGSATEDNELGIRLALAGTPVHWAHHVRVLDEKPTTAGVAVRQRARWRSGKRELRRRYLGRLLAEGMRSRQWSFIDQALRLVNPGRSLLALLSATLIPISWLFPAWFLGWGVWAVVAVAQFGWPIPFLIRDGVAPRYVVRYPILMLLPLLWIPIGIVSRRLRGWYHTPHVGDAP